VTCGFVVQRIKKRS
jgi:hypothetical protein